MNSGQQFGTTLAPDWKQWEGQLVDGTFPLRKYVSGNGPSAVFLTEYAGQDAAIKLVAAASQDADAHLSRWKLASELSHPHLIRLLGFGSCRWGEMRPVYVVMEWADENLAQVVPERQLTTTEVRELLEPALSALAYLHREGFVHGRLKPANILAVSDQLKISSDGLQRISEGGPGQEILPSSDVFSLAAIITEALTQRLPGPVVVETLPEPFRAIVQRCSQPAPESRWTIPQIEACLRPAVMPQPWWRATGWRYVVALAALGLILLASIVAIRQLTRRTDAVVVPATPVTSVAPVAPVPQPEPPKVDSPAKQKKAPQAAASRANPEILSEILPVVPPQARNTIRGVVRVSVRINVDPSGEVTEAKIESQGPSGYFADLALKAARRWKFRPRNAAEEWIAQFDFLRNDTKVSFKRVSSDAR